jgi:hypothetical protein
VFINACHWALPGARCMYLHHPSTSRFPRVQAQWPTCNLTPGWHFVVRPCYPQPLAAYLTIRCHRPSLMAFFLGCALNSSVYTVLMKTMVAECDCSLTACYLHVGPRNTTASISEINRCPEANSNMAPRTRIRSYTAGATLMRVDPKGSGCRENICVMIT